MLNLRLSAAQSRAFALYATELIEWNERFNLTAIHEPQDIEIRHFADSLSCLKVLRPSAGLRVIDVGAGAGFPGLPLKIVYPEIHLTLVEATGKKVTFLEHMVAQLKLDNVTVVNARAEEVGQDTRHRETYDWVVARAVAGMRVLAEYMLPLSKVTGHCLAQKGENAPQEVNEAGSAIKLLGGDVRQLTPVELPTVADTRYLVDIAKVAATPPQYPRGPGRPTKRPL